MAAASHTQGPPGGARVTTETVSVFAQKGYVVLPQFVAQRLLVQLRALIDRALVPLQGPVEFEADVGYAGAPTDRGAPGGQTPRRLLAAYSRHELFQRLATSTPLADALQALTGTPMALSQCHHNCIMTKCPGFSSDTAWHQDIRYWSFQRPELISAWFALTDETPANGSLRLIPASHNLDLAPTRFDAEQFLRADLVKNQVLIERAEAVELQAGDLLLFHSRTFHAATKNMTDNVKLSAVFTYHALDNPPTVGSRSAQQPSIPMATLSSLAPASAKS